MSHHKAQNTPTNDHLIALLESAVYPLAAGAYMSAALLVLVSTPAILRRGADEERLLLQKFGREHEECQRRTWFQARSWCSRNTRIQQTAMSK